MEKDFKKAYDEFFKKAKSAKNIFIKMVNENADTGAVIGRTMAKVPDTGFGLGVVKK